MKQDSLSHELDRLYFLYFSVRCVLGCMVLAGLYSFSNAIEEKFGKRVKQLLMIITASQFHFMFYMSRPLPNTFALSFGKFLFC